MSEWLSSHRKGNQSIANTTKFDSVIPAAVKGPRSEEDVITCVSLPTFQTAEKQRKERRKHSCINASARVRACEEGIAITTHS